MFLFIASFLLLGVIAGQDYFVPKLRNETISQGLSGKDHLVLDATYVLMALALALSFIGHGFAEILACVSAGALLISGAADTFSKWVDKITKGKHSVLHTALTIIVFIATLWLESTQNHGWMWWLSGAGLVLPGFVYPFFQTFRNLGIAALPAAEKTFVTLMCVWMMIWAFLHP